MTIEYPWFDSKMPEVEKRIIGWSGWCAICGIRIVAKAFDGLRAATDQHMKKCAAIAGAKSH